jgi:hypothetical protein
MRFFIVLGMKKLVDVYQLLSHLPDKCEAWELLDYRLEFLAGTLRNFLSLRSIIQHEISIMPMFIL